MSSDFDYAQDLVYRHDRDRYLCALFAPAEHRPGLMALYAFNLEIARVRELVSDPLPGEVRLQWWRDFLAGTAHGDGSANPVAAALARTIERYRLPVEALIGLIDARVFDLYDDPMPTLNDLEGYAGETASALIQLAAIVLADGEEPGTCDVAGHAGVAYALTGLMRALPWHAARRQLYLPADLLDRHGVDRESLFRGVTTPELKAALAELHGHVRHHLGRVRGLVGRVSPTVAPAFLPVCLVEPFLKQMERPGFDPLHSPRDLSQLRRQWIIWRAARRAGCALAG
ncbi:phytoene/squalene synthase family protein [Polymorphum gilvum]|uniref:Phytoene synthase protein n=1 Tax=Polymorphum gilvum (strain LMG 25793 / CGMCC 1.9160 / SL003B-26A1) TaxID=991905 RepID=F2IZ17_POLGS|nr:phytoene/squalene synthase family protein [Polymorphum gilvum]ADZ70632.1 Phytoene synthase protein [Polymorphum gilvum SL003B-26A1]